MLMWQQIWTTNVDHFRKLMQAKGKKTKNFEIFFSLSLLLYKKHKYLSVTTEPETFVQFDGDSPFLTKKPLYNTTCLFNMVYRIWKKNQYSIYIFWGQKQIKILLNGEKKLSRFVFSPCTTTIPTGINYDLVFFLFCFFPALY